MRGQLTAIWCRVEPVRMRKRDQVLATALTIATVILSAAGFPWAVRRDVGDARNIGGRGAS